MASKRNEVETVVVGAGLAGIAAARALQARYPSMPILVLESGEGESGRSGALQLVDAAASFDYPVVCGPELKAGLVRYEREWLPFDQVPWDDKDWIAVLPQWEAMLKAPKRVFKSLPPSELGVAVKSKMPVRSLRRLDDASRAAWRLETPEQEFIARRVVWAAGLTAFQNAVGKVESQAWLERNPRYSDAAAEYRGGIAWEIPFNAVPEFQVGAPSDAVMGLPVRHNGKLFLMICALNGSTLQTLTHVPDEILQDPKEILSLQKSLRRGLKSLVADTSDACSGEGCGERWIVSSRMPGHALGTPGLLGAGRDEVGFVGEECLAAAASGLDDALAALKSVAALTASLKDAVDLPPTAAMQATL